MDTESTPSIFPTFAQQAATPQQEVVQAPQRKKRGARKAAKAPTRQRRPRADRHPAEAQAPKAPRRKRTARPLSVAISILPALAGMNAAEATLLMSIVGNLNDVGKKSRLKVIAALGRILA